MVNMPEAQWKRWINNGKFQHRNDKESNGNAINKRTHTITKVNFLDEPISRFTTGD